MQNGQTLMTGGDKTNFDHPDVIEALEVWKSFGEEHKIMPKGTIEWGTLRQNFLEGKTAMMWHSTGNLTTVKKKADFDFGVAMLPAAGVSWVTSKSLNPCVLKISFWGFTLGPPLSWHQLNSWDAREARGEPQSLLAF